MAGLNPPRRQRPWRLIRRLVADGLTVLMVEHIVWALMDLARRIMVLSAGEKIADGPPAAVAADSRGGRRLPRARERPGAARCLRSATSRRPTATSARSPASRSGSAPARSSRCSARTARARPRCSAASPACYGPRAGAISLGGRGPRARVRPAPDRRARPRAGAGGPAPLRLHDGGGQPRAGRLLAAGPRGATGEPRARVRALPGPARRGAGSSSARSPAASSRWSRWAAP